MSFLSGLIASPVRARNSQYRQDVQYLFESGDDEDSNGPVSRADNGPAFRRFGGDDRPARRTPHDKSGRRAREQL
jgi:hypothetical protein